MKRFENVILALMLFCLVIGTGHFLRNAFADSTSYGNGFLDLADTPKTGYSGQSGKAVVVKGTEDGLEFGVAVGGGGTAAWGNITGTLSDQTDLQAELDALAAGQTEVVYTPMSTIIDTGTLAYGNNTSVQGYDDGEHIQVNEVGGVPGFSVTFVYKNVSSFQRLKGFLYYQGGATHVVNVQLYRYATTDWETYATLDSTTTYEHRTPDVFEDDEHISGGKVRVRIYHDTTGNPAHKLFVDYLALSTQGGSSTLSTYLGKAAFNEYTSGAQRFYEAGEEVVFGDISSTGGIHIPGEIHAHGLINTFGNISTHGKLYSTGGIDQLFAGAQNIYFDGSRGTDDVGFGNNTGFQAYSSLQYAINAVPAIYAGNVNIYPPPTTAATIPEAAVIQSKRPSGNYSLSLIGSWSTTLADTIATRGVARTSATANAKITKNGAGWTSNAYQHKMLFVTSGTGSGQVRPILLNNNSTISVEAWTTTPDSTSHFEVRDWLTTISGSGGVSLTVTGTPNVVLQNLKCTGYVWANNGTNNLTVQNCDLGGGALYGLLMTDSTTGANTTATAPAGIMSCYIHGATSAGIRLSRSTAYINDTWIDENVDGVYNLSSLANLYRNRVEAGTGHGLYAIQTGKFTQTAQKSSVVDHITAGKYGSYAEVHGSVTGTANIFYNNNTVGDEQAVAGSYGYID